MTYRDDHQAALARAEALALELEHMSERAARAESELAEAHARVELLERQRNELREAVGLIPLDDEPSDELDGDSSMILFGRNLPSASSQDLGWRLVLLGCSATVFGLIAAILTGG